MLFYFIRKVKKLLLVIFRKILFMIILYANQRGKLTCASYDKQVVSEEHLDHCLTDIYPKNLFK